MDNEREKLVDKYPQWRLVGSVHTKIQDWKFYNSETKEVLTWDEYIERKKKGTL